MAVQWTEQQAAAIENRGGTLLVSAAAGSGKTAVLVERILRRITDPNDPKDIDSFLIVTFTKAAAAEMRGKIADQLSRLAAEHPENARLATGKPRVIDEYPMRIFDITALIQLDEIVRLLADQKVKKPKKFLDRILEL